MLIQVLFMVWDSIIKGIFGLIPDVTLASLPVVGATIQDTLVDMILVWNAFLETVPYMQIVWSIFLLGVIPLEIGIVLLKVFLGNRSPVAK